ncbi:MAG: hypothetical protein ACI3YI_02890 [Bacteroidaceae bacterium]
MDKEKEEIIAEINALQEELKKLNVKSQTFVELIGHLRARTESVEHRKTEIHKEIQRIKVKVDAWTSARKKNQ